MIDDAYFMPNTIYKTPVSLKTPSSDDNGDDEETEEGEEDGMLALPGRTMRTTSIGDLNGLNKFYKNRFWVIKQKACREIAKAWVKTIHPKKQATNPYNGGREANKLCLNKKSQEAHELRKPKWWPNHPDCPHVEPDHQQRPGRIILLQTILKHCGDEDGPAPPEGGEIIRIKVSIAQLEASTNEIKAKHLGDDGAKLLDEIYTMKNKELQVLRGEIGKHQTQEVTEHCCR